MIKKLYWMLGYNNLSIILEQERKHWLLKTDSNKQIQNAKTGDIFQGMLENVGSDVAIESKKLPYNYSFISDINFNLNDADKILNIATSAFPHSAEVNGFMFARIISVNYPYNNGVNVNNNHYKIRFTNTEECILPFGASTSSDEVYADKWIKTTTPPSLLIFDPNTNGYTIELSLAFNESITNPVWYYPLTETLQPLELTDIGNGSYELAAVNNNDYIGYPLFWFTCDQSNIGPTLSFTDNTNSRDEEIFFISNAGNDSPYNAKIYTGLDGDNDATPDGTQTSNYTIRCSPVNGETFNGTTADFDKAIDPASIKLIKNGVTEYPTPFVCNANTKVTMTNLPVWEFVNATTYEIDMDYFDQNSIHDGRNNTPLVSVFDVVLDKSIPFVAASTDVGIAGIRMGSANIVDDVYERYPYNLNRWKGLPDWLNNMEEGQVPQHNVIYAFHQPPDYDPENPESMQGAGLILDPGLHQSDEDPDPTTDNIGRVYVLSNDDIEYHNNNDPDTEYKKPPRTAARICDIPTSVMQMMGTSGLSSGPIVDQKYVRTEASYSGDDRNKLYNTLASKWVRPSVLIDQIEREIVPAVPGMEITNLFAFDSKAQLDLIVMEYTDFREMINLNPMVDTTKVHLSGIMDGGTGYQPGDTCVCIVGGFAFTLEVETVDPGTGAVLTVIGNDVCPPEQTEINLANFDMDPASSGATLTYSTSPLNSTSGRGLKIRFYIEYNYYMSIITQKGQYFTDLFAFVRESDGAYVYNFKIDTESTLELKPGTWVKGICISEYDVTTTDKSKGGVSVQESFINSIIPSLRTLPIVRKRNNEDPMTVNVMQSASFVNIIDTDKSPVVPSEASDDDTLRENIVDMCKLHCDGLLDAIAPEKSTTAVFETLRSRNAVRYDSYIIWRWKDPTNPNNKYFEYGVVYRGFNNLFTTDSSTMLPKNELKCDNYVHLNGNTTVVWNVNGVGPMLWVYDPNYTKKEDYYINPETMDLHVHRSEMTYADIDIRQPNGEIINVVEGGVYKFNIITNNPMIVPHDPSPIYQQPDIQNIITVDTAEEFVPENKKPKGNWRLVFPRVESYRLTNDQTGTEWIPMKMQVIKGRGITDIGNVLDADGNNVSMKSLIVVDTVDGEKLSIYNSTRENFERI